MQFPSLRSALLRSALPVAALCALLAGEMAFAKPPKLKGKYSGTYKFDDSATSAGSFVLEIGQQDAKDIDRIDILATNFAQFEGHGTLTKKNSLLIVKTQGYGGGGAPHMNLVVAVSGGSGTLSGTFELKRKKLPVRTGTFIVTR